MLSDPNVQRAFAQAAREMGYSEKQILNDLNNHPEKVKIMADSVLNGGLHDENVEVAKKVSKSDQSINLVPPGPPPDGGDGDRDKEKIQWADPDISIEKQLQGRGQLKDLRNSPNIQKGVNINNLFKKTPRQLEEMRKRGDINDKTFKQIKKAFAGRDLSGSGKNK